MPAQGRLGDKAQTPSDAHGCPACPHPGTGPAIAGSPDVNVNDRPALREGDSGMHAACCGANSWTAAAGSATVFINGKPAHRVGDQTRHCGGSGQLVEGSPDVFVGDATSAGAGRGAAAGAARDDADRGRATISSSLDAPGAGTSDTTTDGDPPDLFVLAVKAHAIGGVPLAGEWVEIVECDTGNPAAPPVQLDDDGAARILVDKEAEYDLRILSDFGDATAERWPTDAETMMYLTCRFVDAHGRPLAGAAVTCRRGDHVFETITNDDGAVDGPAEGGRYELAIAGSTFAVHTVLRGESWTSTGDASHELVVDTTGPLDPDEDPIYWEEE